MSPPQAPRSGIALAVLAVALFAAYDSGVKLISATTSVVLVLWTRYLLQVMWLVGHRRRLASQGALRTRRAGLHGLRAAMLLLCNVAAFYSFKHLPVATVTALAMLAPMLLTAWAALVWREPVSLRRWAGLSLGLVGALLITRPGAESVQPLLLLPLGFLLAYTVFQALTSRLARTESPDTVLAFTSALGFTVLSAALLWSDWSLPSPRVALILLLVAACSAVGHHLLVMAYQHSAASRLAPYLYGQLPFAALGGLLLFGEVPDAWSLAGGGLIAAAGVFSARSPDR